MLCVPYYFIKKNVSSWSAPKLLPNMGTLAKKVYSILKVKHFQLLSEWYTWCVLAKNKYNNKKCIHFFIRDFVRNDFKLAPKINFKYPYLKCEQFTENFTIQAMLYAVRGINILNRKRTKSFSMFYFRQHDA